MDLALEVIMIFQVAGVIMMDLSDNHKNQAKVSQNYNIKVEALKEDLQREVECKDNLFLSKICTTSKIT
jgi:hypothetical protein